MTTSAPSTSRHPGSTGHLTRPVYPTPRHSKTTLHRTTPQPVPHSAKLGANPFWADSAFGQPDGCFFLIISFSARARFRGCFLAAFARCHHRLASRPRMEDEFPFLVDNISFHFLSFPPPSTKFCCFVFSHLLSFLDMAYDLVLPIL